MQLDPYYVGDIARIISDTVYDLINYQVIGVDGLGHRACEIDHQRKVIEVQSGLSLPLYQFGAARAWLRIAGGPEAAPEFHLAHSQIEAASAGDIPRRSTGGGQVRCLNCRSVVA